MIIFLLIFVTHGSTSSSNLKSSGDKFKADVVLVEGDMFLNKFQVRNLAFGPRNGMIDKKYRWPKNKLGKVIVPYKFNETSAYCESLITFESSTVSSFMIFKLMNTNPKFAQL